MKQMYALEIYRNERFDRQIDVYETKEECLQEAKETINECDDDEKFHITTITYDDSLSNEIDCESEEISFE